MPSLSVGYLKADVFVDPTANNARFARVREPSFLNDCPSSLLLLRLSRSPVLTLSHISQSHHPDEEGNLLDVWAASIFTGTPRHLRVSQIDWHTRATYFSPLYYSTTTIRPGVDEDSAPTSTSTLTALQLSASTLRHSCGSLLRNQTAP